MAAGALRRDLGLRDAVLLGLGAVIGTGVFVSIGIAAGVTGPSVILAIGAAALVATCNALSSAQLAANMPVSGGTYEYGYAYLHPAFGFTAGWMFLVAKTASAATAALGFAGYVQATIATSEYTILLGLAAVLLLTAIVLAGIRRSNTANIMIVSVTLAALAVFVLAGLIVASDRGSKAWQPFLTDGGAPGFLEATALMFVAFAGYARIATLGEEVRDPRHTIPRAIIITLAVSAAIYVAVAATGIATVGADGLAAATTKAVAPLVVAAQDFSIPAVAWFVALGAVTAMLGVLLNLILGLSRMLLAMGRRRDMPAIFERIGANGSPSPAIIAVGFGIAALVLVGNVKTTWSFSAFSILVYYAITNLAALRLPREQRLYHSAVAWVGLAACVLLAFFVERQVWILGIGLIAAGLVWHALARRISRAGAT